SWRAALAGHAVIHGLVLKKAQLAIVRDGPLGAGNLGELSGSGAGPSGATHFPVRLEESSLQLAYRDLSGLRWVVRADGLEANLIGGTGAITATRVHIEVGGAAAEFSAAHLDV